MSKLSIICLFLLTICFVNNLSSAESTQNGSNSLNFKAQIVGGWSTAKFQYTASVFWQSNSTGTFCIGTFIAQNALLTTAHCCVNFASTGALVYLNDTSPNHAITNEMSLLKCHINPGYKSLFSNDDIAIIELTKNIDRISPATLDYSGVKCGETVWVFAFGRFELNQTEDTFVLKEELVDNCNENEMILTYGKDGSMCQGDSGGPMFNQNGALVGLHSGSSNCSANGFNLAVRLSSHKHFIETVLHQNRASYTFMYLLLGLAILIIILLIFLLCFALCISILYTPIF